MTHPRIPRALAAWAALALTLACTANSGADDRYTVCSITINSQDEINTFRKYLPESDFRFVELAREAAGGDGPGGWIGNACQSGVQCDILVVSGHFLTTFVGDSGLTLSLAELERQACEESCPGILNRPLEVFLFGCKTLAAGGRDLLLPSADVSVLSSLGVPTAAAERIVAERMVEEAPTGGLGSPNQRRMRFVFAGVPNLYGFSAVGPSGERVRPLLEEYFKHVGDYAAHLRRVDGARRARDVDASRNLELARALQPSSVDQAVGLDPADVDYDLGARSCFLKSERHPALDRLERIEQLLDDPGFLGYLPAVEAFLHLHPPGSFDAAERAVFQRIQKHDRVRERFQKLIYDLATPVVRLEMLSVARIFGWMSDDEALGLEREIVLAALRPPVYGQGRDLVCGIDPDLRTRLQVRADELRPEIYTDEFGIQALGCLKPADDRIHLMLSRSLFDRREWIARYAAIALKEIRPARVDVQLALAQQLGRAESGPRKSAGEALREIKSADPRVLETIRKADPSFQIDWP